MDDVQEAVESAKKAQANALEKLEVEINLLMARLPEQLLTCRDVDLVPMLEDLAGMLRAKRYIRLSITVRD